MKQYHISRLQKSSHLGCMDSFIMVFYLVSYFTFWGSNINQADAIIFKYWLTMFTGAGDATFLWMMRCNMKDFDAMLLLEEQE